MAMMKLFPAAVMAMMKGMIIMLMLYTPSRISGTSLSAEICGGAQWGGYSVQLYPAEPWGVMRLRGAGRAYKERKNAGVQNRREMLKAAAKVPLQPCSPCLARYR